MKTDTGPPTKPGVYFARHTYWPHYDLIVRVYGSAPYLKARKAWRFGSDSVIKLGKEDDIIYGPEVIVPERVR